MSRSVTIPPIASNFVAGETSESALAHVEELNARGIGAIVNLLGEHYEDRADADADADQHIDLARDLHEEYGTPYEVQMLMGVREDEQFALADDVEVYQYVPYGSKWFSYFYRRVREQKSNAVFAVRAVVGV